MVERWLLRRARGIVLVGVVALFRRYAKADPDCRFALIGASGSARLVVSIKSVQGSHGMALIYCKAMDNPMYHAMLACYPIRIGLATLSMGTSEALPYYGTPMYLSCIALLQLIPGLIGKSSLLPRFAP